MNQRSNYVAVLEITTLSPLTHGAGNNGNESVLRTTDYLVDVPDPEIPGRTMSRRLKVPIVSGAAFKSTLRQHCVAHLAEALGIDDGALSRDALRLLLKGGKNDSSGQSVSLEEHRRLRGLFPMLAVFGSMDGGMPITAQIKVSPIRPYCQELVDAGLVETKIGAMEVSLDGDPLTDTPMLEVYPDDAPQRLADLVTVEQYYRHDMSVSPLRPLIDAAEMTAIEDKQAARKGQASAKKEIRREANESMPHAHQAIVSGARLFAEIRLNGATEIEWQCLAHAILRWVQHGALLGGATTKGHGRCRVKIAGDRYLQHTPAPLTGSAPPSTALSFADAEHGAAYLAHIRDHADAIREQMCAPA